MTAARPKVAVLLATYNAGPFLDSQISSILAQTGVDVSLHIRDDGSADGTVQRLADLAARRPEQIHVVQDELGASGTASANFFRLIDGFEALPGTFVALSDQDDVWFPDKLSSAIERLGVDDCGGYSSNLVAYNSATGASWLIDKSAPQRRYDYLFQGASAGCTYVLTAIAFGCVQSAMRQAPEPVSRGASHDWMIYAICRSAGIGWTQDPQAHIMYRQHTANVYGAMSGASGVMSRLQIIRAKWYRQSVAWISNVASGDAFEAQILTRVRRLSIGDRVWLARHAGLFRRRAKERYFLIVMFLSGIF